MPAARLHSLILASIAGMVLVGSCLAVSVVLEFYPQTARFAARLDLSEVLRLWCVGRQLRMNFTAAEFALGCIHHDLFLAIWTSHRRNARRHKHFGDQVTNHT